MSHGAIRLDHIRLDVTDIEVSARFYRDALDLREVVRYDLGDRTIVQLAPQGQPPGIELWQECGRTPAPHATQHVAFSVADVAARVERVRSLGNRVIEEPYRIGEETVAFIADPDGHVVELNDFRGRGTGEGGRPGPAG
jgi:catechol 2,3-dioxygenase-like lactoylglutathione lyase family enzyme